LGLEDCSANLEKKKASRLSSTGFLLPKFLSCRVRV
jgi:hypothetical protein